MTAVIIDGKQIAREIRAEVKAGVQRLQAERQITPGLAVILAGDHPASCSYVASKEKACGWVGMASRVIRLPQDVTQAQLLAEIDRVNRDPAMHGLLVQLPLPAQIDERSVIAAIDPAKDVDGFHRMNAGALFTGGKGMEPCTPRGCVELLRRAGVPLAGAHAVVVGRSNIVGKPVAMMLLQENCTVTICHSRTRDLAALTRQADILVCAIGRANFITAEMVKPGAAVIDVGINRQADGTLTGDVDFAGVSEVAGWITPVPGGVGPMTIAMLLKNTLQAAQDNG